MHGIYLRTTVLAGGRTVLARAIDGLLHIPELALTAKIPVFLQTHFLLGGFVFVQGHNAVILVIKQLGLGQVTQSLVGVAVPYLDTRSKQFLERFAVNVVVPVVVSHRSFHDTSN